MNVNKPLFTILLCTLAHFGAYSQAEKGIYKDSLFISTILQQHNAYRSALHLPALQWSPSLATDALAWAQQLAKADQGQHDPQVRARNEGENIWWGTAGAYSYGEMANFWGSEKKEFVYGVFPDCKTRHSAVVGHYTQIVWRGTSLVGCAAVSNGKTDFLVCRYSPPGNVEGQKPY